MKDARGPHLPIDGQGLCSVRDLNAKIRAFIDGWNDCCHPFVWTKTADQILDTLAAYCTRINDS